MFETSNAPKYRLRFGNPGLIMRGYVGIAKKETRFRVWFFVAS